MNDPLLRTPGIPGDRSSGNRRVKALARNHPRVHHVLTRRGSTAAHVESRHVGKRVENMPSHQRTSCTASGTQLY